MSSPTPDPARPPPSIWALQAEKVGDNAQIDMLLEAVGLPVTVKRLRMRRRWQRGKPKIRAGLKHLDRAASDALEPPWPDLVVLSGRRLMNVALWLREQSQGRTRLVLIGRPHGHYDPFDLIVAAPQFRLPARANVINLELPLSVPSQAAIDQAAQRRRDEFAALARPLTAVLVGGPTQRFRLGPLQARSLIDRTLAATDGAGTLYVSTSRRTPTGVVDALAAALPAGARLFRWTPDAPDNPYPALLALADRFVVTADSASMLVEVARLGRPLAIFELSAGQGPGQLLAQVLLRARAALRPAQHGPPKRDLTALHRVLYRQGLARPLDQGFSPPSDGAGVTAQLAEIRKRVLALLECPEP